MRLPRIALTKMSKALLPFGLFMFSTLPALAHELWIEPESYRIASQTKLVANIVNGQDFAGHALPYLPRVSMRLDIADRFGATAIEARAGDRPAINVEPIPDSLNILIYHADRATLTYHQPEKFWSFVEHKDLGITRADHEARGLPEAEFKEVYSRYSKALIGVGTGAGSDYVTGLQTEIVAMANPYTDDMSNGLAVRLLYRGYSRTDAQIEIFDKSETGEVVTSIVRTNQNGIARIPVTPGHSYMLDAVLAGAASDKVFEETGAAYISLWANLTFSVPNAD